MSYKKMFSTVHQKEDIHIKKAGRTKKLVFKSKIWVVTLIVFPHSIMSNRAVAIHKQTEN